VIKDWMDFVEFLMMLIRVKFGIVGNEKEF